METVSSKLLFIRSYPTNIQYSRTIQIHFLAYFVIVKYSFINAIGGWLVDGYLNFLLQMLSGINQAEKGL